MREDPFVRELLGHLADLVSAVEGVGVELEGIREALVAEPRSADDEDGEAFGEAGPDVPGWVNGEEE